MNLINTLSVISFMGLLSITNIGYAQSSQCKYNGSESAIVSELSRRNTNTGKHKLNQEELEKIAGYWVADCKCKRGVETIEEAKKLSNRAFQSRYITAYQYGKSYEKDLSVFEDLKPPFTSFHPNWCLKGNNSTGGMSLESGTDCAQEASRISDLDGQLSAYAGQFFVAYCQCKNGVPSQEYANQLIATMKSTHKSFNDFKNASTARLSTQPLTSCDITGNTTNNNRNQNQQYENQSASVAAYTNAQSENIAEALMSEYAPQDFAYLKYSQNIARQGEMITQGLTNQLKNYNNLIETSDPQALLLDFQSKMQNIESLEQNYKDQSFNFGYQRGAELADQISSGDGLGALGNVANLLTTGAEMKEAEKKLAAQKEALKQQRIQKMSDIYWNAVEANNKMIDNYYKRAAYAESLKDEQFNLAYVENLQCYARSMEYKWSSTNTSWLQNNCPQPKEPLNNGLQNFLIDKDEQKINTAERKLKLYDETNEMIFLEAAVSFAGAAANIKPSAKNYFYLGDLYRKTDIMLAYAMMLSANEKNKTYFDNDKTRLFDKVKDMATKKTIGALKANDTEYFKVFLSAKLNQTIRLDGKTLLSEAIRLDKPDIVQLIINENVKSLNAKQRTEKIQQAVIMAAIQNSPETIKRISDLGIDVDFELKGNTPLKLAGKANAVDAYNILKSLSSANTRSKVKNSLSIVEFLAKAEKQPFRLAEMLDKTMDDKKLAAIVTNLVEKLEDKPAYLDVLVNSDKAIAYVNANSELKKVVKINLAIEMIEPNGQAYKYFESGLLRFLNVPNFKDLFSSGKQFRKTIEKIYKKNYSSKEKEDSWQSMYNDRDDKEQLIKRLIAQDYSMGLNETIKRIDKNIAFIAYERNNQKLFKAIDKQYNLSDVKDNDITLKDYIFNFEKPVLDKVYYSEDFSIVMDKNLFKNQLSKIIDFEIKYDSIVKYRKSEIEIQKFYVEKLFNTFDYKKNQKLSMTEGTILHWTIDDLLKKTKDWINKEGYINTDYYKCIFILGIDPKILDNQGLTAFDYLKKNKKEFKKLIFQSKTYGKRLLGKRLYNEFQDFFSQYNLK